MTNLAPYLAWLDARLNAARAPMEPYLAWLDAWFDARLNEARALSPDTLLLISAAAVLLVVALFVAWRRTARRAHSAKQKVARLEADLAAARSSLEEEIRWRMAAKKCEAAEAAAAIFVEESGGES